jgi:hypothetical protein
MKHLPESDHAFLSLDLLPSFHLFSLNLSPHASPNPPPIMATKVALVTASSAGLGAAIVKALAPNYRCVVNYYSRPEKAAEVIKEATAIPALYSDSEPRFHSIQADVSNRAEVSKLVSLEAYVPPACAPFPIEVLQHLSPFQPLREVGGLL